VRLNSRLPAIAAPLMVNAIPARRAVGSWCGGFSTYGMVVRRDGAGKRGSGRRRFGGGLTGQDGESRRCGGRRAEVESVDGRSWRFLARPPGAGSSARYPRRSPCTCVQTGVLEGWRAGERAGWQAARWWWASCWPLPSRSPFWHAACTLSTITCIPEAGRETRKQPGSQACSGRGRRSRHGRCGRSRPRPPV